MQGSCRRLASAMTLEEESTLFLRTNKLRSKAGDDVSAKLRCRPFSFLVVFTFKETLSPNFSCEGLSFFGDQSFRDENNRFAIQCHQILSHEPHF